MGSVSPNNNAFYGDFIDGIMEFEFPFTYNDSYDYSYEAQGFDVTQKYYYMHDSSTVLVEADACGIITTPTGTWQNSLRIKKTQHQYLWVRLNPGDAWLFLGDNIGIEYRWMAPGIKMPVMFVAGFDGSDEYTVHYLVDYSFTTGVAENADNMIKIFPNPATDWLTIESPEAFNNISLFLMNGRQMNEFNLTNPVSRQTIGFSKYLKCVYLIEDWV